MAHHNNTPASILNAPERTYTLIHANTGTPRKWRRHVQNAETGKVHTIPKEFRSVATNIPYVKGNSND